MELNIQLNLNKELVQKSKVKNVFVNQVKQVMSTVHNYFLLVVKRFKLRANVDMLVIKLFASECFTKTTALTIHSDIESVFPKAIAMDMIWRIWVNAHKYPIKHVYAKKEMMNSVIVYIMICMLMLGVVKVIKEIHLFVFGVIMIVVVITLTPNNKLKLRMGFVVLLMIMVHAS